MCIALDIPTDRSKNNNNNNNNNNSSELLFTNRPDAPLASQERKESDKLGR